MVCGLVCCVVLWVVGFGLVCMFVRFYNHSLVVCILITLLLVVVVCCLLFVVCCLGLLVVFVYLLVVRFGCLRVGVFYFVGGLVGLFVLL